MADPSDIAKGAIRLSAPVRVEDLDWDRLVAVDAFLEDLFVYDHLNVVLEFETGLKLVIDEDLPGFLEVAIHIAKFQGVSPMWQMECTQPAFHREVRPVFRRTPSA